MDKKRRPQAAPLPKAAPLHSQSKKARLLRETMTEVGTRADLSVHALGRLLVATPLIFDLLTTREVRHLRRADKTLRSLVAEHAWSDGDSPVHSLTKWRSCFPAAKSASIDASAMTKAQLPHLASLTGLGVLGFCCKGDLSNELPLAFVRGMPLLEALRVTPRSTMQHAQQFVIAPSAPVWRELGHLRDLHLELPLPFFPADLLSHLGSVRKLFLADSSAQAVRAGMLVITDAGLACLPYLEELRLRHIRFDAPGPGGAFTGACFAHLPRLSLLDILGADLPRGVPLPQHLVSLAVCRQEHLANSTLAPLVGLESLQLDTQRSRNAFAVGDSAPLSPEAFAGLTRLETFDVKQGSLAADGVIDVLAVLNAIGRLRHLAGDMRLVNPFLASVSGCPIIELKLQLMEYESVESTEFAAAFRDLRSLSITYPTQQHHLRRSQWGARAPFSDLKCLSALDLSYSPVYLRDASFSDLQCLLSLNLTGCVFERSVLRSLPPSLSSLILDRCKSALRADDATLAEIGQSFPALSYLSLAFSLYDEATESSSSGSTTKGAATATAAAAATAAVAVAIDCGGRGAIPEVDTGGPAAANVAPGWAALLRNLPHGLLSLDVRYNNLSFDSYALVRENVAELRADASSLLLNWPPLLRAATKQHRRRRSGKSLSASLCK